MHRPRTCWLLLGIILALVAVHLCLPLADSACCYFSAKNADILQPAQKVFITWDPTEKMESFTVQPKFEGNALDFGMVIPTPSQPKLNEMPRDFFKHLAIYTIMRKREFANSKLLPLLEPQIFDRLDRLGNAQGEVVTLPDSGGDQPAQARKPAIRILEVGTVGSLDYKIIE